MIDKKPVPWADALLILWVLVVGIVYFGGLFVPAIGALTGNFGVFYAIMVLVGALTLARKFLHPAPDASAAPLKSKNPNKSKNPKNRK